MFSQSLFAGGGRVGAQFTVDFVLVGVQEESLQEPFGANLAVRRFGQRFNRLTLGDSKTTQTTAASSASSWRSMNFGTVHKTLGCTPAVGVRVFSERRRVERFLKKREK